MLEFIEEYKPIIEFTAAALTPTIAIIALYIAWQQWRTNRARTKIELFEKRIELYQQIADFMGSVLTTPTVEQDKESLFLTNTRTALFLFDSHVTSFVNDIFDKAGRLHCLQTMEKTLKGDKLDANLKHQDEIKHWFKQELKNLPQRFSKFLSIYH